MIRLLFILVNFLSFNDGVSVSVDFFSNDNEIFQDYLITNKSQSDIYTWVEYNSSENSTLDYITRYFHSLDKGQDLSFAHILSDNVVITECPFLKKITPNESFHYMVPEKCNKENYYIFIVDTMALSNHAVSIVNMNCLFQGDRVQIKGK